MEENNCTIQTMAKQNEIVRTAQHSRPVAYRHENKQDKLGLPLAKIGSKQSQS